MAAHRYWRIHAIKTSDTYFAFQEIELRSSVGGADLTGSGAASASATEGGNVAANAVDNNSATFWGSYSGTVPQWWQYDFGEGNAYDIIEIAITSRNDAYYGEAGVDFSWQYSDDGVLWHTYGFQEGISWSQNETKTFLVNTIPAPWDDLFTGENSSSIDISKWTLTGNPDIQGNAAELVTGEVIASKYVFTGNFDVQVNFAFQSPSSTSSYAAHLNAYIDSTHQIYIGALFSVIKDWLVGYINGGSWSYANPGTRSGDYGKLRIIRVGNVFSLFSLDEAGDWVTITPVTIGNAGDKVVIQLYVSAWDGNPVETCRFDSYIINLGYIPVAEESVFLTTGQNWQSVGEMKINVGGDLKSVHEGWVVVDGNWKPFWPPT